MRSHLRVRRFICLLLAAVVANACRRPAAVVGTAPTAPETTGGGPHAVGAAADTQSTPDAVAARRLWALRGPAAYAVTVTRNCECLPEESGPVRVAVRAGAATTRTYVRGGGPVPTRLHGLFPTVDELFARYDTARGVRGGRVRAQFNARLGYPTRVFIEADTVAADDEVTYVLADFRTP